MKKKIYQKNKQRKSSSINVGESNHQHKINISFSVNLFSQVYEFQESSSAKKKLETMHVLIATETFDSNTFSSSIPHITYYEAFGSVFFIMPR